MLMIISCVRGLESFEEGVKSPSAQTLRDRLNLEGGWLESFHGSMWTIAKYVVRVPLRKKENKNKVAAGAIRFQHWMKEKKINEKSSAHSIRCKRCTKTTIFSRFKHRE